MCRDRVSLVWSRSMNRVSKSDHYSFVCIQESYNGTIYCMSTSNLQSMRKILILYINVQIFFIFIFSLGVGDAYKLNLSLI